MNDQHVPGKNSLKIVLYALSTCVWCKKTKRLLNELGIKYDYIDYDLLEGEDKRRVEKEIEKWNPKLSFPVLVIEDSKCVLGYDESKIKQALNYD
ncbi:NrdH-redoxin [candidate division WOR-3 bacterium RBG_13_43_14]|uniref:NrdH-redoxin n=1 Tax=candidate division WOR-3 bacterium RBG_13_43_14 TaxID=1802590 RepID=A0A1F4UAU2_UNCW3|nr:MAG: NrdH-redoxin [candidate division WOR-3 bacterium RBG_13_43_14]